MLGAILIFAAPLAFASIFTVPQGGTGVNSITGIIQGNGTAPFSAAPSGFGLPGGSNEDVQYNNGGVFGGSDNFTFHNTTFPQISFGDLANAGNQTKFVLSDNNQVILGTTDKFIIQNSSGDRVLYTNGSLLETTLGDVSNAGNDISFDVDDSSQTISAYTQNGIFSAGDINGVGNNTLLDVDDSSQTITNTTNGEFHVADSSGDLYANIAPDQGLEKFGDITGIGTSTLLGIDMNNSVINAQIGNTACFSIRCLFEVTDLNGNKWLEVSPANGIALLGDLDNSGNGTQFEVDDSNENVNIDATSGYGSGGSSNAGFNVNDTHGGNWFELNPASGHFDVGDLSNENNGTYFDLEDSSSSYAFNKPNFTIDAVPYVFPSSQGTASTVLTNDGSGNLSWDSIVWSDIGSTPTTLSGYGITDAYPLTGNPSGFLTSSSSLAWTNVTGTPTTLAGYGITNAQASSTSGDLLAQTAAASSVVSVTSPNDGNKHTYSLGGYLNITAVTLDVVQEQVTYTDENGTSQTETFFPPGLTSSGVGTIGNFPMATMNIRVNPNTAITIKTTLVTGSGSIGYDVGGTIQLLN